MQQLAVQCAKRPAGAWLRCGALQQFVQTNIQHLLQRHPQQGVTTSTKQPQCRIVGGAYSAATIERQQPFAEQTDVFGLSVKAQQIGALAMLQKEAAFDQLRRQIGQRHGVKTLLVRQLFARR